jgi:hypothetical protein
MLALIGLSFALTVSPMVVTVEPDPQDRAGRPGGQSDNAVGQSPRLRACRGSFCIGSGGVTVGLGQRRPSPTGPVPSDHQNGDEAGCARTPRHGGHGGTASPGGSSTVVVAPSGGGGGGGGGGTQPPPEPISNCPRPPPIPVPH